jgi:hypothetical protein
MSTSSTTTGLFAGGVDGDDVIDDFVFLFLYADDITKFLIFVACLSYAGSAGSGVGAGAGDDGVGD